MNVFIGKYEAAETLEDCALRSRKEAEAAENAAGGMTRSKSSSSKLKASPSTSQHRGSRESLESSQFADEEQAGIKTKIFHALGLNS